MANRQQQLAFQKQSFSHVNKNHLTRLPSFSDYKDAPSSFSMLKNLTDKPQKQLTQSPSSSGWKDAADAFTMLINMTHKPQEPYSSEIPSSRRLTGDSEVWLLPKKLIMQAPTKNPNQWREPQPSWEDRGGCYGSHPHHEPSSSEQPHLKRPTPDSDAWLRPRKPIMQASIKNPNQRYATPVSREDQLRPHQSFEFEPSSSGQPFPKRSTPNFEVLQGPRKPEPKPYSSEQQYPKRPTSSSDAWLGPRKQETSSSKQPFPKHPTANFEASQRARNLMPFPSQTPNQRRDTPPRNPQPDSNSRPTNTFLNPNSRPSNTSPPKFNPDVKRKVPDIDFKYRPVPQPFKYRPAPQPSIECITDIIKRRSVDDYFCELCQVNSSSATTLRQHLRGRKHMNNARYCRPKNISLKGVRGIHRCDVCHISCTDKRSLTMHLKGKMHLERLQKMEHGEVGVQKPIRCELCMANCMNEDCFDAHIHGKQHAVQLELASRRVI